MFSRFFIERPVFATVCSLIIVVAGILAIPTLPIAQFPDISPTQVVVTSNYAGADAETVESAVTNLVEQEVNGVQGMRYISSSSGSDGTSQVTVTFEAGQDPDLAAVNVQNRVSRVEPRLPGLVTQTGVTVSQQSSNFLMAIAIYSENGEYDSLFMSNYADLYMVNSLRRITGVGSIEIFGERKFAMRVWLDPNRLASRGLTVQDVSGAIREQNIQVGAGQLGQQPANPDQEYQLSLRADSRLQSVEEFENLVVSNAGGTLTRLRDVGRVELGAENYGTFLAYNNQEAVGLGITQRSGTNALETAEAVRAELERLKESFPPGLNYAVAFDSTTFVERSLEDVIRTLVESVVLVVLVLYLFLQDWRSIVVPGAAIPVSLFGTFIFTKLFDFSINTLTLFGLTLATGVVVDDAIVVVEAIAAKVQDRGMHPFRAAVEAMQELSGAVVATSLALIAVFVPVALFPGTTGAIYQQFALTIAFSIVISTFNALTLSPALAALLLRQREGGHHGLLGRFFDWFNAGFDAVRNRYRRSLSLLTQLKYVVLACFVAALALTAWVYRIVPSSFLPEEDQGYFITLVQAPEGVSLTHTKKILDEASEIILEQPEILSNFAITGFSFAGVAPNQGIMFSLLKPWEERTAKDSGVASIIQRVQMRFFGMSEARIFSLNPPSIQGLGNFGGFQMEVQDRRGVLSLGELLGNTFQMIGAANQNPNLQAVFTTFTANTPQMLVDVNRDRAKALNIDIQDIYDTLQSFLGSEYVNDFNLERRTYRVYVQADEPFRSEPNDLQQLYVRSGSGEMVPLANLVTLTPATTAQTITHYNLFRSISVQGNAAPGRSSGEAIGAIEGIAKQVLPASMGYDWTGTALEEIESGGQAPIFFGLGLLMVFLVLAAQYESYIDPIIILITVPLAILGALGAQSLRGLSNDVYCQIGLVMLIGLVSKNSILIVEYANQLREKGLTITQAAIEAAQDRLRPILMTSLTGIVGFFPLVIASGAGAASRQSLGTALFGGYIIGTVLSLFITPMIYILIKQGTDRFFPKKPDSNEASLGDSGVISTERVL
ncbi:MULTISPECIES: efflux RND transporter permease subunit [unclassified Leptolyngbya]|uniref:efflux RND transporter permease subunit n=1 Tax=unclassified Leptolyngbya TaxID=2650499 RepID=UPI001686A784|nr:MULTISPECIES: efflux RND transporter permease subunit [unclassified Leptolyngbya]MBD1912821.1 efflux RND transporter permease subunit [Leptolyngbya sp. FACHB-8]MBD2157768.1 efflux RND transporter permease subunit [Leptolyngbya sp. FACHB-16]